MSSKDPYGVWYGNPTTYTQQSDSQDPKSPHIYLRFTDSSSATKEAAINVQSTGSDTRLVYWFNRSWTHPITEQLSSLSLGFHQLSQSSTPAALDYWRTEPALFDFQSGKVLDTGDSVESDLDPIIQDAINAKAKMYIFGESYGTGIHDIHCNQGSKASYGNATYQAGALIFAYTDGHYEAVFLAFASQKKPTNDQTGAPTADSQTLASLLGAPAESEGKTAGNTERSSTHHAHHGHHKGHGH